MLYEQPNGGTLSALVGDPSLAVDASGASLADVCDDSNNCHYQSATAGNGYSWGTNAELSDINLVVLQGCVTANNSDGNSIAQAAWNSSGYGTVIGFTQNITFALYSANYDQWGYAWGSRFWSDLNNGSSYSSAMIDAANYEYSQSGGWYGYDSYYMYGGYNPYGQASLYPAQYSFPEV
jgi:hypothetical protein